MIFVFLFVGALWAQQPECTGTTCTIATDTVLTSRETVWRSDGSTSLTLSAAVRCGETAPNCILKALGYTTISVAGSITGASSVLLEATERIAVEKKIDVSKSADEATGSLFGGGGYGGDGGGRSKEFRGNPGFGQPLDISLLGQRGGGDGDGGLGGGLVRLIAPIVSLSAPILATGQDGTELRGAGSGGGVYVAARTKLETIAGFSVDANGGTGLVGAGGGGRVAFVFGEGSVPLAAVSVRGGSPSGSQRHGGAGTVYVKGGGRDALIVSGLDLERDEQTATVLGLNKDSVLGDVVLNKALVRSDDDAPLVWALNGTFVMTASRIEGVDIDIKANGACSWDKDSSIDVAGRVHPGTAIAPATERLAAAGVSAAEEGDSASGASHGGLGGNGFVLVNGEGHADNEPWGSALSPRSLGSWGGAAFVPVPEPSTATAPSTEPPMGPQPTPFEGASAIARGGGAIRVRCGGKVTFDGEFRADGESAPAMSLPGAGGASGGSIWLDAGDDFVGAGLLSARGGDASGRGGGGGGGRIRIAHDINKVNAAAMVRRGVIGVAPLKAPKPPPLFRTVLPKGLRFDVQGGKGFNDVAARVAFLEAEDMMAGTGPMATFDETMTRHGGAGTMAAVLGLRGARMLIENEANVHQPTFVGDGSFSHVEVRKARLRGSIASNQLLLGSGAFIADTKPLTLNVQHTRVTTGGGIAAPSLEIRGTTLQLDEGFVRALGQDRSRLLDAGTTLPASPRQLDGESSVRGGGGGASGGDGGDGEDTSTQTVIVIRGGKTAAADIDADAFAPKTPGGNGGSLMGMMGNQTVVKQRGGAGGGSVFIELRGALTLNGGKIDASGEAGLSFDLLIGDSGSGAGGSVFVRARSIEGSGQLLARGADAAGIIGGAGGGGRVVLAHQLGISGNLTVDVSGGLAKRENKNGGTGTIVTIREILNADEAVVRRFPSLRVVGAPDLDLVSRTSITRIPLTPQDNATLDTLRGRDGRWTDVLLSNVRAQLPTPVFKVDNITMSNVLIKQSAVNVNARLSVRVDATSVIDASSVIENVHPDTPLGGGGPHGGNGGTPKEGIRPAAALRFNLDVVQGGFAGNKPNGTTTLKGGAGGGMILLEVSEEGGVAIVDGSLLANGGAGGMGGPGGSGGGSGGGILVRATSILGAGAIEARGGSASADVPNGGAGAGGRVALLGFGKREDVAETLKINVNAGSTVADAVAGGIGTIYRRSQDETINEVLIEGPAPRALGSTVLEAGTMWPPASADKVTVIVKNAFVVARSSPMGVDTYATSGNVIIDGGFIQGRAISLIAQDVTLRNNAHISATGMGPATKNEPASTTLQPMSQVYGAGGGHSAGYGLHPSSATRIAGSTDMKVFPDPLEGDFRQPTTIGQRGGDATPSGGLPETRTMRGGLGGGRVKLTVKGELVLEDAESTIEADGGLPQMSTHMACAVAMAMQPNCDKHNPFISLVGGGGGGGGSVWIDAKTISGPGTISASGGRVLNVLGTGPDVVSSPGGAGGGGWIALYYESLATDVVVKAWGGRSQSFAAPGTAGLVFHKNMLTFAENLILENGVDQQQNSWPPTTLPKGDFARLTLRGGAIARAASFNVAQLELSGNAQMRATGVNAALVIRTEITQVRGGARIVAGDLRITALTLDVDDSELSASGTSLGDDMINGLSLLAAGGGGGSAVNGGGTCGEATGGGVSAPKQGDVVAPGGRGGSTGEVGALVLGGLGGGTVVLNVYDKLTLNRAVISAAGNPGAAMGSGGGGGGSIEFRLGNGGLMGSGQLVSMESKVVATGGEAKVDGGSGTGGLVRLVSPSLNAGSLVGGKGQIVSGLLVDVSGGVDDMKGECSGSVGQLRVDKPAEESRVSPFCRPGRIFNGESSALCKPCDKGTSNRTPGGPSCADCVGGTFAKDLGSIECTECFPGTFANGTGSFECTKCAAGKEAPQPKSTTCTACKPGSVAPQEGTPECGLCEPGSAQNDAGKLECNLCEVGSSTLGKKGERVCTQCKKGTEAPVEGSPTCELCDAGFFSAADGDVCTPCAPGDVSLFEGRDSCEPCPAATFSDEQGSATCTSCPPGAFSFSPGQGACIECPEGTFTDQERTQVCSPCEADTFSKVPGALACAPCPEGTRTQCQEAATEAQCTFGGCKWRAGDAVCVTVECEVCTDDVSDAPDCLRWDRFSPTKSRVVSSILDNGVAETGDKIELRVDAYTGLDKPMATGGLLSNFSLAVTPNEEGDPVEIDEPIDHGNGSYSFFFEFNAPVEHTISLKANDVDVDDSPYLVAVEKGSFPLYAIVLSVLGGLLCLGGVGGLLFFVARRSGGGGGYETHTSREMSTRRGTQSSGTTPLHGGLASYEIAIQDLIFEQEIGRGAFGVVYKGQWRDSNVAIKQLLLEDTSGAVFERELATFQAEAKTMSEMRPHANVILLLGITPAPNLCIVVEFAEGGCLYPRLHDDSLHITPERMVHYCKGVASGMSHLHHEGVVHRDLAARNVLLDGGDNAKVSDFGLSRTLKNGENEAMTKSDVGPLKWMAPEAVRDRKYSERSDVWSYGVTLFEITAREDPYPDIDALQAASGVVFQGLRLQMPYDAPPVILEVAQMCFQTDPGDRPSFSTIIQVFKRHGY